MKKIELNRESFEEALANIDKDEDERIKKECEPQIVATCKIQYDRKSCNGDIIEDREPLRFDSNTMIGCRLDSRARYNVAGYYCQKCGVYYKFVPGMKNELEKE